ncbi:hypothetical protein AB4Y77_17895 [Paenarthrobacter sp. YAF11_1]|uniref:hypothetical protein n=1 Tax=Paenarthrobacter sp. YAF11_1 TaxID=3233074 RepID=UPI003F9D6CAC
MIIRNLGLMRRIYVEWPQPAKALMLCFPAFFILSFILAALKLPFWAVLIPITLAGVSVFSLGFCIFRDIRNTATTWSLLYRESKNIAPDGFTIADVPTIKGMGFMYMLMGVMFVAGSLWTVFTTAR